MEKFAVEAESIAGPCALQNLDRLERAAEALRARDAEAVELFLTIALAEAEAQASVGDDIDDRGILGDFQRMLKWREQDEGADGHLFCARGDCGGSGKHRGEIAIVSEVMFGEPDGVVAEGFG